MRQEGLLFELLGERADYRAPRYRFAGGFTWGDAITEGAQDTMLLVGLHPDVAQAIEMIDELEDGAADSGDK